jgi:hypothetical protein
MADLKLCGRTAHIEQLCGPEFQTCSLENAARFLVPSKSFIQEAFAWSRVDPRKYACKTGSEPWQLNAEDD